jgi:2-octaprenyl-6-methoxyphenol hydroxylase
VALLPLAAATPWCGPCPTTRTADLRSSTTEAFLARLSAVFGGRHDFIAATPARRLSAGCATAARRSASAVWLGNAAQTLHPVAGQGFNLALRDVSQLADRPCNHDAGRLRRVAALLARYARGAAARSARRHRLHRWLVRLFGMRDRCRWPAMPAAPDCWRST